MIQYIPFILETGIVTWFGFHLGNKRGEREQRFFIYASIGILIAVFFDSSFLPMLNNIFSINLYPLSFLQSIIVNGFLLTCFIGSYFLATKLAKPSQETINIRKAY